MSLLAKWAAFLHVFSSFASSVFQHIYIFFTQDSIIWHGPAKEQGQEFSPNFQGFVGTVGRRLWHFWWLALGVFEGEFLRGGEIKKFDRHIFTLEAGALRYITLLEVTAAKDSQLSVICVLVVFYGRQLYRHRLIFQPWMFSHSIKTVTKGRFQFYGWVSCPHFFQCLFSAMSVSKIPRKLPQIFHFSNSGPQG